MTDKETAEAEVTAILERAIEESGYELSITADIEDDEARTIIMRIFLELIT